ncbi:hypothetical protein Scep_030860 [Stephania cephalantha]|uniref:Uncharacterized protein n=1 Tax=Stephania cephalantha TaxID=152367 RepID=A0AAP0HES8_9MAGN
MSSVDLHTHYSYQIMLRDAVAIVMAPTDSKRHYGIFRLSEPGGITVVEIAKRGLPYSPRAIRWKTDLRRL